MRGFSSDIRYALRAVRHGGISIAVAVLSLAVGVGANAAIFSVGHAMLARPLPYAGANRLVMLRSTNLSQGVLWTTAAPANLLDWQAQAKSFEAIAGYRWWSVDLTGGDHSERLRGLAITPEFFKVLDVPLMGGTFDIEAFSPANPQRRWIRFPAILPSPIPKRTTASAFASSRCAIKCWAAHGQCCSCCSPPRGLCCWSHAETSRTCFWPAPQRARKKSPYARPWVLRGFESCDSSWPSPL